jgi:hypothetical protein
MPFFEKHCVCDYCGAEFIRPHHHGRQPRYCRPSHRVRACERRRGLLRARERPIRPPSPEPDFSDRHHIGMAWVRKFSGNPRELMRTHRARPYAAPDPQGYVPSLCGHRMKFPEVRFSNHHTSTCKVCEDLADLHPVAGQWWSASTQQTAFALLNDLQSTALAVKQAAAQARPAHDTITRLDRRLDDLLRRFGLQTPPPSLHPSSCRT